MSNINKDQNTKNNSITIFGHSGGLIVVFVYTIFFLLTIAYPKLGIQNIFAFIFPGFEWISWKSIFIGLVESYVYGWLFGLGWYLYLKHFK